MKRAVRSREISVRHARKSDAAALANLMTQLGYPTRARQMSRRLLSILRDRNFGTFVATQDRQVCGMIGVTICRRYEHNDRGGRILALVIDENFRRRGVARSLILGAEKFLRDRKIERVAVNTHLTRKGAHKFYDALGYRRNGFRFVKTLDLKKCA